MESLKKQRAIIKGSMTKLLTFVKGSMDNINLGDVSVRHERAVKLLSEFQSIERNMFELDSEVDSDLSEFEDNYYFVVARLNATMRKKSLTEPDEQQLNTTAHKVIVSPAEEANDTKVQIFNTGYTAEQRILPTAIIKIKDGSGQYQTYRALLDSASQTSFISEECMQDLRLRRTNARVMVKGLGETGLGTTRGSTELVIAAQDNATTLTTQAFIVPKVSGVHNEFKLSEQDVQTLSGLMLADPAFNKHGRIDVLLGVDVFFKAIQAEQHTLSSGLTAVRTMCNRTTLGKRAITVNKNNDKSKTGSCDTKVRHIRLGSVGSRYVGRGCKAP